MNPTKKHRLRCCGRESSPCSISGICNGTLVRNTVTIEESRVDGIMTMTNEHIYILVVNRCSEF